ncbi:MAG: ABC transporter permease [Verrucomicrobia bacterium]|nr:ABC transporter permease [Verrucomicrobiota bacterium]
MLTDLKYALRSLLKTPGFTLVAVLTIAVGIGANTALFTVFNRLILNPVTLPQPSSLVALWTVNNNLNFNAPALSWPRYEEIRTHARSFSSVGNSAFDNFTLTGNGEPEQLSGLRITSSFFPTLGLHPLLGRNFTPAEDAPNGPAVALLSYELWQTRFGSRASIIGETIQLNGQSWQVVGVMPPKLSNPFGQTQVFAPRPFEVAGLTPVQIQNGASYTQPVARLAPGVTLAQANAELAALSKNYGTQFSTHLDAQNNTDARLFTETLIGNLRPTFYTLLGAVAFVLLIACANVASLFLGRLSARQKEIAVRQSLGAARGQIVRQFLLESLVFSAVAGALGLLFSLWALSAIESASAAQLPPNTHLALDWTALAFTGGVTVLSALLVGFVPALQASGQRISETLKDTARGSSAGVRGGRFRATLIVAEVALSVVLLVGSGLLLFSFLRLQRTPSGFNAQGVAAAFVGVPVNRYKTNPEQALFFNQVIDRLAANPQVKGAAAIIGLPLSGGNPVSPYSVGGRPVLPLSQRPLAGFCIASDDYFKLLQIPVREGRTFNANDRDGAPGVCVINESFAKRLFPGESAVGKILLRGRDADIKVEIVGIVADVKSNGLNAPPPDSIYYSMRQVGRPGMGLVAKIDGDPAALQSILRSAVAAVDKDQPISFFQTMDATVAQSLGTQRIVASLTVIFAGLALVLAAVGLYSVLAYAVAQRTGEIGIRMALGAQPGAVVAMILRGGLRLVGLGLVIGLAFAAVVARLMASQLFAVEPFDPLIYGGVTVLFAVTAVFACLLPALRASRVDPLVALRAE